MCRLYCNSYNCVCLNNNITYFLEHDPDAMLLIKIMHNGLSKLLFMNDPILGGVYTYIAS